MNELKYNVKDGFLCLEGKGSFLSQPGYPAAVSGTCTLQALPLLPGTWKNYLARLFTPDRNRLRLAVLDGIAWLAKPGLPQILLLPGEEGRELCVVSEFLLACPPECRLGATLVRPIPASTRSAFCVTRLKGGPVALAAREAVTKVEVTEGETLCVSRASILAWAGAEPKGHCAKLTVKDLLLPRVPGNLTLLFRGPASVWIQTPENENQKTKRKNYRFFA